MLRDFAGENVAPVDFLGGGSGGPERFTVFRGLCRRKRRACRVFGAQWRRGHGGPERIGLYGIWQSLFAENIAP